jgi:hypothetical protein
MNKKILLITLLLITIPLISLFSQSNEELDRFLNQEQADVSTSVWLVYLSTGTLPLDASLEDAMTRLMNSDQGKYFTDKSADSLISFKEFALIAMSENELPGGLMYTLFKSPRYAAREMTYKRWMPGKPKPGSILTPWDVTTAISQILTWKEENR